MDIRQIAETGLLFSLGASRILRLTPAYFLITIPVDTAVSSVLMVTLKYKYPPACLIATPPQTAGLWIYTEQVN
jgi:hypothetical protein